MGSLLAALLVGCANPAGVDGNLTDDWKAQPEAAPFVPASGVCHLSLPEERFISRAAYNPLDCGVDHHYETVFVGEFTGSEKDATAPPETGTPAARKAYDECNTKVNEYVGADWRGGRLKLFIYFPAKEAWEGGSRWFRCDVAEVLSLDSDEISRRSGSLKDILKASFPVAFGCFRAVLTSNREEISAMNAVTCGTAHGAEFAGVWTAPEGSYADFEKNTQRAHDGCRVVIAKWAKVPNDGNLKYRTGTIIYFPDEDEWADGNRGVQCFLWISDQDLRRSMKGAGPGALRIR
ncbi:septum formation family protein [Phytohabitans sp. ZYX-F-186]|uniref:Septum formation family protein n=1 Tax=Phytohabitans maris TaxID=3071409 RepID=A0ABU0ZNP3_9ACTN|nr:septum formation family protein [Phytohabitans sp. ZYX-F-186]MDQ7907989.1 septum formation family protein [Phytohabitans sp. ZYX-F-186]